MQAIVTQQPQPQPQKKAKAFAPGDAERLRFARYRGQGSQKNEGGGGGGGEVWLPCLYYSSYQELVDTVRSTEHEQIHNTGFHAKLYFERMTYHKNVNLRNCSVVRFLGISTKRPAKYRMRFLSKEEDEEREPSSALVKDFYSHCVVMEKDYGHRVDFHNALAEVSEVIACDFDFEEESESESETPPQANTLMAASPSGGFYMGGISSDGIKGFSGETSGSGSLNDAFSNGNVKVEANIESFHTPQQYSRNGNSGNNNSDHPHLEIWAGGARTEEPIDNPQLENPEMQANSNSSDENNVEFGSSSPDHSQEDGGEGEQMVDDSSDIGETSKGDASSTAMVMQQQTAEAPREKVSCGALTGTGIPNSNSISPAGHVSTQKITPMKLSNQHKMRQRQDTSLHTSLHTHGKTASLRIKDVIAADMEFSQVVDILISQFDWTIEKFTGPLVDRDAYYVSGEFKGKTMEYIRSNCKAGEDYFIGKESLMEWLQNRYDWVGSKPKGSGSFGRSDGKRKANNEKSKSAGTSGNKKHKAESNSVTTTTTQSSKQTKLTAPTKLKEKTSTLQTQSPTDGSIVAVPRKNIEKNDRFEVAWDILHFSHGWIFIKASRLCNNIYVHGRCVEKFGEDIIDEKFCISTLKLNHDYFSSRDDLKNYLHKEHGWEGSGGSGTRSCTPKRSRRSPDYRGVKDSNSTKRTLQVDLNISSSPSQPNQDSNLPTSGGTHKTPPSASSSTLTRGLKLVKNPRTTVKKDDDFGIARDILKYNGWKWIGLIFVHEKYAKDEKCTTSYCKKNLEAEKDYFTCDDALKEYLHKTIGWVGPKGKEYTPIVDGRRRRLSVLEVKPITQTNRKKKFVATISESQGKIDASNKVAKKTDLTTKKASKGIAKDAESANSNQSSKKRGCPAEASNEDAEEINKYITSISTPEKKSRPSKSKKGEKKEKVVVKSTTKVVKKKLGHPVKSSKDDRKDANPIDRTKKGGRPLKTPNEDLTDSESPKSSLKVIVRGKTLLKSNKGKKKKIGKAISPGSSLPSLQKSNQNERIETEKRGKTYEEADSMRNSTSTLNERLDICAQCLDISQPRQSLLFEGNVSSSNLANTKGQIDDFLKASLNPKAKGGTKKERSSILYVCGRPGTGKTTMVQHCLESPIEMDSSEDGSSPALKFSIVNGATVNEQGFFDEISKLLNKTSTSKAVLEKALSATASGKHKGDPVVLVIDEINFCWDGLKKRRGQEATESALETIFRWASDPSFRFILIGISNSIGDRDAKTFHKLANVNSEIICVPYTEDDLMEIIKKRIGSNCELVDDRAMKFVARRVAQGTGDCRLVLNLMSGAIIKCQESLPASNLEEVNVSDAVVKLPHVMKAIKDSGELPLVQIIDELPGNAKVILCIHTALGQVASTWNIMTVRMLKKYCTIATRGNFLDELSQDQFIDNLRLLEDQGLLKFENDAVSNRFGYEDFGEMRIRVGVQIQDVECAIGKTMLQEGTFYQNIVNDARKIARENL